MLLVGSVTEVDVGTPVPCPEGKLGPLSAVPLGPDMGVDPPPPRRCGGGLECVSPVDTRDMR